MSINVLPDEILEVILHSLPFCDVITSRQVCKRWFGLLDFKYFWRQKFSTRKLSFDRQFSALPEELIDLILRHRAWLGTNFVRNGSCEETPFSVGSSKFPYWSHVGSFHSTWNRKRLDLESDLHEELKELGSRRYGFRVDLNHGPNEMHQKIKFVWSN